MGDNETKNMTLVPNTNDLDLFLLQTPVIVDQNYLSSFDLLSANETVHESEVV